MNIEVKHAINVRDQGGRNNNISLEKVIPHSIFPLKISQHIKNLQNIVSHGELFG